MRALILAAGQGTRLAPLTDDMPKCLVQLGGVSLLDHQIAALNSLEVTDITVLAGHRAECIAPCGFRKVINPEYATSNMVYTLFCASEVMQGDTDLIIAYGDIVYESRVLQALKSCDAPMCIAVDQQWRRYWEIRMEDPLSDAESLKMDEQGMIIELGKKPRGYDEIQAQYMGLIKVRYDYVPKLRQMYDAMAPEGLYDGKSHKQIYMTSFIQYLTDSGWQVRAVPVSNGWLEVDTYTELQLYNQMHSEGTLEKFYRIDTDALEVPTETIPF